MVSCRPREFELFAGALVGARLQGDVYRVRVEDNDVYRVLYGREGTEVPSLPGIGSYELVESSDFLGAIEFNKWLIEMEKKYPGLDEFKVGRDSYQGLVAAL